MGILGPKVYVQYGSENSKNYERLQRAVDATAVGNTVVTRGTYPSLPRYLRPRAVHYVSTIGSKRTIMIGDKANAIYLSGTSAQAFDGETWSTTGRRGENDRGGNSD